MLIVDTFKLDGKTAVYCIPDKNEVDTNIESVVINKNEYNVLKKDVMTALSGKIAIALLLDTTNDISTNQKLFIN